MKWDSIETFFLDMDGTLLDLSYDNYFWHQHIPKIYAEINNMSFEKAKKEGIIFFGFEIIKHKVKHP